MEILETNLDVHPHCQDLLKDTVFGPPSTQTDSSSRLLLVPNYLPPDVANKWYSELKEVMKTHGAVISRSNQMITPDDDYFDSPVESDLGDSDQPSSDDVHMIEVLPEDKADLAWQPSPEWQERHSAHQLPTREDDEAITARALIEVVPESEKWEVKCPQIAEAKRYLAKLYTSQDPMTQFLIKAVLDMSMQTRLQVVRQIPVPDGPLGHLLKGKGKAIEQHNLRRLGSRK